jgi:uncharacterized delta-60 repeat protein
MRVPRRSSIPALTLAAALSTLPAESSPCCEPVVPALDPTFGGIGYVHAYSGRNGLDLSTVSELENGKILVGGHSYGYLGNGVLLGLRYLADGRPDPSFDGDGAVIYDPCQCSHFRGGIHGFRREGDGTLLFVGSTAPRQEPHHPRHESIALLRYREDGSLGAAPGDDGVDLVDLGGNFDVNAVAFPAAEGAFFVAGDHDQRMFIARVRDRGAQLDAASFAAPRGWVAPDVGAAASDAFALALDAEGCVFVAGAVEENDDRDVTVARLLPDGALDARFGAGGVVRLSRPGSQEARGIAVLPDGRVLVAGTSEGAETRRFLLARLLPTGAPDPTFGDGGVTLAPLGHAHPSDRESGLALAVMKDGRIVVAGNEVDAETSRPVIARFQADGALDPSFGDRGEATFEVKKGPGWVPSKYGDQETRLTTVALTQDGRLLVTGVWSAFPYQGFVARLTL